MGKRMIDVATRAIRRNLRRIALACAAAAFLATAFLPARAVTTHYMPQADLAYSGGFITSEGALVFPGKTLADLEGCGFWGRIAGNAIACVKTALSNAVQAFPVGATGDAIERYDFDLVALENNTVKAVHIQLYNGEGGVYARAVQGWYVDYKANQVASGMPTIHYTVDATTGELTWSGVNLRQPATGPNVVDYGIRALGVARPVTTTATLAYPGLTVAAIAKNASAKLSARMSGTYISAFQGYAAVITPAVVTAGTADAPTAIRCEAQMLDGAMVKSAAFELTDGVGGVHVRLIGGYYKNNSTSIGEPLLAADGTQPSGIGSSPSASTLLATGYGLYNLEVNEEARVEADTSYVFEQNTYLTSTAQLVFPGATLMGLEDCAFYGIMDGGYIGHGDQVKEDAYAHVVKRYPEDVSQPVQKLFLQMSHWDTTYTKNVIVELTGGTGGVYARAVLASHGGKGNNKVTLQSFGVKDDGSGVTNLVGFTNASVATFDHANGYGIKKLGATRMVSGAARLAFPGLKVSEIFRGEILGRTAGRSINDSDQFTPYSACNRVITSTDAATGAITGFRVEMQTYVGYIKCVELRFTDGEGGVYVEAVRACYADTPYASVGRRMIALDDSDKADGTKTANVASGFWDGGYGVCNLAVALPDDASTGPATAVWNGGDPALAASWTCKAGDGKALPGVFPDKHTQVLIASSVTMTADADLTPYASMMTTAANFTINTAGHKLYVKSLDPWHVTTITDTAGGGELHLVVPEGYQTYNNIHPLSGKLKLVKDGEGLYLAVRLKQAYSGGTEIKGGIATTYGNAPTSLRNWSMGGNGINNPSGQVITVSEGGTLDINGNTALGYTSIIFNGGTVYGASTQFNGVKRLTADSFLVVTDTFKVQNASYPLELNGHKLSVQITGGKSLHFESCPIKGPGTFEVTSGGWLNLTSSDLVCTDADFVIHCALNIGKTIDVHDYRARYNYDANTWGEAAALNVHGTFTPETDYFTAATLMDGATLDLSEKTGVWSTTSLFTNGNTLSFAAGTIYVDLGEREIDFGESGLVKIVSWAEKPADVKFKTTVPKRYSLSPRDDGLYCVKTSGTVVFVR
ncbi:MAG: hypothetical protein IKL96_02170 [Kiritimatiellae bacterium]|nr:hypothetical protein [Kiritimatiellia bacterium]